MKKRLLMLALIISVTLILAGCKKNEEMTEEELDQQIKDIVGQGSGQQFEPEKNSNLKSETIDPNSQMQATPSIQPPPTEDQKIEEQKKPKTTNKASLTEADLHYAQEYLGAILHTNLGDIVVKLYPDAPMTISNFLKLSDTGFYNGSKFHRVIKGFMIQGGDPNSKDDNWNDDGFGGPDYKFADEINDRKLVEGSLAMANSGPNTNGSQFFIVTAPATPHLDGKHTNFGYVTEGMEIVKEIENVATNNKDHPINDIVIESIDLIPVQ